jgi:3-hydroxybutyryl-CoA dehydrogenase
MGAGIAAAAVTAGDRVRMVDIDAERTRAGVDKARRRAARLSETDGGDLSATSWQADLTDVELVVEAVAEDRDLKIATLRRALEAAGPDAVVATNTSSLSVTDLATQSRAAERVLGLHFFSPAHSSRLVEAVGHPLLRDRHLACATGWAVRLGKTVVQVPDAPGFLVNRVARPLYLEAERFVEAGADPADVDAQLRAVGLPVGPLEIVDRTGLDVHAAVSRQMYEQRAAAHFRPVAVVESLVAGGRTGLKSGRGFLEYVDGRRSPRFDGQTSDAEAIGPIARLVLAAYVNEAALTVDEGYADRETVDLALKLALSHPVGPFGWVGRLGGGDEIVRMLAELNRRHHSDTPTAQSLTTGSWT